MPSLRRPAALLHHAALGVLLILYFTNHDMGRDPVTPRGDGIYRPILARGDGHLMWLQLRSLILDGDLHYGNDLATFNPIWDAPITPTGRPGIVHPIGPALVWAGPFALAHVSSKLANLAGADIPAHGYTLWHQRFVYTTSPLFAFAAVVLGFWMARRLLGGRAAPLYASLAVLFGTSITAYALFQPWSAHPMDAAATAAFVAAWIATLDDRRWRRFALLGALLGLCALIRVTGLALVVAPALELAVALVRSRGRDLPGLAARGLVLGAAALVVFSPQLVAWKIVYGEWLVSPMGPGFMRLGHPQLVELLFSSRNGWFSTTPIAYAGVLGLFLLLARRGTRLVAVGLLAVLAVQLHVNASVYDWWAGASFGARRMCSMTALLVVGLAAWLRLLGSLTPRWPAAVRHGLVLLLLGWLVLWNANAVGRLRAGRTANIRVRPSCCDTLPPFMRAVAQPVYDLVGNPFQLPASALFGWRHDVPWQRWDLAVGEYVFEPTWYDYRDGKHRAEVVAWKLRSHHVTPFLLGGLDTTSIPPRLAARSARILLSLLHPEAHRIAVWLSGTGTARLRLNGKTYTEAELQRQETEVAFEVPAAEVRVGENVLEIVAPPGTAASRVVLSFPGARRAPRAPRRRGRRPSPSRRRARPCRRDR